MTLIIIRTFKHGTQPEGFGIGYRREISWLWSDDFGGFAFERSETERFVLRENLLAVQVVEGFGGILTGYLTQNYFSSRVRFEEVGDVVDLVVDDEPDVVFGCVLDGGGERERKGLARAMFVRSD